MGCACPEVPRAIRPLLSSRLRHSSSAFFFSPHSRRPSPSPLNYLLATIVYSTAWIYGVDIHGKTPRHQDTNGDPYSKGTTITGLRMPRPRTLAAIGLTQPTDMIRCRHTLPKHLGPTSTCSCKRQTTLVDTRPGFSQAAAPRFVCRHFLPSSVGDCRQVSPLTFWSLRPPSNITLNAQHIT